MSKTLYVGVDIHLIRKNSSFLDQEKRRFFSVFSLPNNLPGTCKIEKRIDLVRKEYCFNGVKIATEATSFLDLHPVDYLANSKLLQRYSPSLYQLNPKTTRGFKNIYPDKDKTDIVDAFVVACFLRFGRLPKPYEEHQPYFPLKRLTRYCYHLVKTIVRKKNYFLTYLFLKYSSYKEIKPFSNLFRAQVVP